MKDFFLSILLILSKKAELLLNFLIKQVLSRYLFNKRLDPDAKLSYRNSDLKFEEVTGDPVTFKEPP